MTAPAIRVEGLSKQYAIGARASGSQTFREMLVGAIAAPFRRWARLGGAIAEAEQFWALQGLNFEVKSGEALGIIGRNGAGKSTLLKILSRITEPTQGRAVIRGRVSSLLEVGTGFHPELTGRENIMLNGAILGMSRREILRKFDEIVAFAEVAKFLETPVKHYSSGMYVRLAFAVAAHLEPDILIVDEVLAVGDAAFQKKCLGKMEGVAREGKTVLFVSHNMPAITRLCSRALLLDAGRIALEGDVLAVTRRYLGTGVEDAAERKWEELRRAPGDEAVRLKAVRVITGGQVTSVADIRNDVVLELEYITLKEELRLFAGFAFYDEDGTLLFFSPDFAEPNWAKRRRPRGSYRSRCTVPGNLFAEGQISVTVEVSTLEPVYEIHVIEKSCLSFHVVDRGEPGSVRDGWGRAFPGLLRPELRWDTEKLEGKDD